MPVLASALCLLFVVAAFAQSSRPLVVAHRAGKMLRPENTLAAFRHAAELGADVVELDVVITRDDRVLVNHDRTINLQNCFIPSESSPQEPPLIRLMSFAETQRFDCGSRKPPEFPRWQAAPGARMPALEEVFELLEESEVDLLIETKLGPDDESGFVAPFQFAKLVHQLIQRHAFQDRVILQSGDYRTLTEMRKLDPSIRLCQLVAWRQAGDWVRAAIEFGASHQLVTNSALRTEDVRRLHRAGVTVFSSTANDAATWQKLIEVEVDGILTDDPAGLIEYLKSQRN